jgi:hypothetical protein
MTKRDLEQENERLRGEVDYLRKQLEAAIARPAPAVSVGPFMPALQVPAAPVVIPQPYIGDVPPWNPNPWWGTWCGNNTACAPALPTLAIVEIQ